MDIQEYAESEQVDPAVDLGLVPPGLPKILTLRGLVDSKPITPPILVEGILHQGCKMILAGTSKSNKSWCLLDLGMSVAAGAPWWGRQTTAGDVLYINFELQDWACHNRVESLAHNRPDLGESVLDRFHIWNLRGHNTDLTFLRPQLMEQISHHKFAMIIIDPAYKVLGDRDENANGEIAALMNEFEAIAKASGAAVVLAHHFAKGDSSQKQASDRMSGAGAWVRDPDAILVMSPHEEDDCFTVSTILRNLPKSDEFVVRWSYPLMTMATDLNPDALRTPQSKKKICTDSEFVERYISSTPTARKICLEKATKDGFSSSSFDRYVNRLDKVGAIKCAKGVYWK